MGGESIKKKKKVWKHRGDDRKDLEEIQKDWEENQRDWNDFKGEWWGLGGKELIRQLKMGQ